MQKEDKDASKSQPKKDARFEGACFLCREKDHKFFKCLLRDLVDKLRKEGQIPKASRAEGLQSRHRRRPSLFFRSVISWKF